MRVGPGLPTAAARRALLARGGSGGRGPGSWARWAPGCPPTRAGKVGCGSLLTIPPLTVITVPDSLPLPLECFSPGLSKAVLCYAVTWGSSCLVVFLRASSSARLPRVAQGDWTHSAERASAHLGSRPVLPMEPVILSHELGQRGVVVDVPVCFSRLPGTAHGDSGWTPVFWLGGGGVLRSQSRWGKKAASSAFTFSASQMSDPL